MKPPEAFTLFCSCFIMDHYECHDKDDERWFFKLSCSAFNSLNFDQKQKIMKYFDFLLSEQCSSAEI